MKKIISILLSALLIIASLSGLTTVCQALDTEDDTVYPGDQITITYSFAKDIPAGCPCYLFRTNYPFQMVKYTVLLKIIGYCGLWLLQMMDTIMM